jgi:hypothetical protein
MGTQFITARDEAKLLIARQIAINNGLVWGNLKLRDQYIYLTLAENILATVERKAEVKWK